MSDPRYHHGPPGTPVASGEPRGISSSASDLSSGGVFASAARGQQYAATGAGERVAELEMRLRRIAAEVRAAGIRDDVAGAAVLSHLPQLDQLTPRQAEVLDRLLQGQRVGTIANELYINPSTVRNHLAAIFQKLEVHSQSELLEYVRERSEPIGP
jgi:DNA-binding NarL/FixJ family response regulator